MQSKQAPPMTVLYFSAETTLKELGQFSARALYKEAIRLGLDIVGPVHWTYFGANGDPSNRFRLEVALPVDRIEGEPNGCSFKQYEPFRYIGTTHNGPWDNLGTVYPPLMNQIAQEGHTNSGVSREVYVFWDMSHPEFNITDIQVGIQ